MRINLIFLHQNGQSCCTIKLYGFVQEVTTWLITFIFLGYRANSQQKALDKVTFKTWHHSEIGNPMNPTWTSLGRSGKDCAYMRTCIWTMCLLTLSRKLQPFWISDVSQEAHSKMMLQDNVLRHYHPRTTIVLLYSSLCCSWGLFLWRFHRQHSTHFCSWVLRSEAPDNLFAAKRVSVAPKMSRRAFN